VIAGAAPSGAGTINFGQWDCRACYGSIARRQQHRGDHILAASDSVQLVGLSPDGAARRRFGRPAVFRSALRSRVVRWFRNRGRYLSRPAIRFSTNGNARRIAV
jgi:hypothetical protein